jgi:hypothetical protein
VYYGRVNGADPALCDFVSHPAVMAPVHAIHTKSMTQVWLIDFTVT